MFAICGKELHRTFDKTYEILYNYNRKGIGIMDTILATMLSTMTGLIIGYLVRSAKGFGQREKNERTTLQALLRNAITTKYYVYSELGHIPEYERRNLIYLYEEYRKWQGNSYVTQIVEELLKLPVKDN